MNAMLRDQVALVIGGASGIGRASAIALAGAGASVVVADLDSTGAEETVTLIENQSQRAVPATTDITREEDVIATVALAVSRFGAIHVAVNVAGGGDRRGPIGTLTSVDFDVMIALNLKGTFLAMHHELNQMATQGTGGSIVNISSTAGLRGIRGGSLYAAAKHGVLGLTKCAALDYAAQQIRVNAICPGAIDTPQLHRVLASRFPDLSPVEALEQAAAAQPSGRVGTPEEVANWVVWLATAQSSFMTGQALIVDGGATI